jgi:FkbM family methyltransferase
MYDRSTMLPPRVLKFLQKPAKEKLESVRFRLQQFFPTKHTEITLPFGSTWIAESSALDAGLRAGQFEQSEASFVDRYLQPGMTVLDIGAHHGYYTLLASLRVAESGKVIAFEPSPRERKRLKRHVHLNKCGNVKIEPYALGSEDKQADLFLVQGVEDYCNSLRPPAVQARTRAVKVKVTSVDGYLSRNRIERVDFIKLDTEGAEREVLRGAVRLLRSQPQPVVLSEIAEIRTAPWGYSAREIVGFMENLGYHWFSIETGGTLKKLEEGHNLQDTNLVAIPGARQDEIFRAFGKK